MTRERAEDGIRAEFEALRADVERPGGVPDFGAMMTRARAEAEQVDAVVVHTFPHRRAVTIGGWMSLAAAAAAVGLLLADVGGTNPDDEFERLVASYTSTTSASTWRSPTSGLLELPGLDLGGVPAIGWGLDGADSNDPPSGSSLDGRDS